MTITAEVIAYALGGALITATIWFPITYFATRKYLQLRYELVQAWRPYLLCVATIALVKLLGLESVADAAMGRTSFVVPVAICAAILYYTFRAPAGAGNK